MIAALAKRSRARLSVDTRKAEVMRRAVLEGAHIINDVSALTHDPIAWKSAAIGVPAILMHALGDPRTMQVNPTYDDVVLDVYDALEGGSSPASVPASARPADHRPRHRLRQDPGAQSGAAGNPSIFHGLGCG